MNLFKRFYLELLIFITFLVTRIYNLTIIPIFTDEAIYSYWAQVALHDPSNRYISLEDGKQPLFIWIASFFQSIISDPLVATRSVSILGGCFTLVGIYLLSKELFGSKVAKFSLILYVLLPFGLLYDRMALYDSLLTGILTFLVYFSVKMAKKPTLENSLLVGIFGGLGLLTKSSALLFICLLPAPLIILSWRKPFLKDLIYKWLPFSILSFVIAQVIFNSLRLSPLFYLISRKNYEFIRPVGDFLNQPFSIFVSNFSTLFSWQLNYFSYPLFVFFLVGLFYFLLKRDRKVLMLSVYILFPFFVKTFFNIRIYPRFMLFYYPLMLIIIAQFFNQVTIKSGSKRGVVYFVALLALILPVSSSVMLLTNPAKAMIANSDKEQYISSWPAGYGVNEVAAILKEESKTKKVYVGTEGTFGLLPYALKIYFYSNDNVQIEGFWPVDDNKLPDAVSDASKRTKTFFIFNENQKEIHNQKLKMLGKYQKGTGQTYMRFYEVI